MIQITSFTHLVDMIVITKNLFNSLGVIIEPKRRTI